MYSSKRIVALSEFNDFNCHYEPFKDFAGSDKVLRDYKYPMPTMESILQNLPSKRKTSTDHTSNRTTGDVRLNFDDEEIKVSHPTYQNNAGDGLQGQGEEITLTNAELSDLQQMLDSTPNSQTNTNINSSSRGRDRFESAGRIDFDDNLINVNPAQNPLARDNRNSSIPRQQLRPSSGRNLRNPNQATNQRSFIAPQQNQMQNMNFNQAQPVIPFSQVNNQTQVLPQNFSGYSNVFPQNLNLIPIKARSGGPKPYDSNNIPIPRSKASPPKPDGQAVQYATEDWFSQVDNKGTNKATEGTKDANNMFSDEDDDSFLLQLAKQESSNSDKIDPDLIGVDLVGNNPMSPSNKHSYNSNDYGDKFNQTKQM
jgi:hypothetical protein